MFGFRKKKLKQEDLSTSMMRAARELGRDLIACAPQDRPLTVEELKKVETFVFDLILERTRERLRQEGTLDLVGPALPLICDRLRQEFSHTFYGAAPLRNIAQKGQS